MVENLKGRLQASRYERGSLLLGEESEGEFFRLMLVRRAILHHHLIHTLHYSLKKCGRKTRETELKCWRSNPTKLAMPSYLTLEKLTFKPFPEKGIQMSSKIKDDRQTFESSWNMIESNLYSRITIRYNSATSADW